MVPDVSSLLLTAAYKKALITAAVAAIPTAVPDQSWALECLCIWSLDQKTSGRAAKAERATGPTIAATIVMGPENPHA